jgi:hypothetical protein
VSWLLPHDTASLLTRSLHNRVEMERDSHVKALSTKYRAETMRILRKVRSHEHELESNTYFAAALLLNHNDVSGLTTPSCPRSGR